MLSAGPYQIPNRSPAERLRFGEEEQRHERALTFLPKAQKVGASDIKFAPTWCEWRYRICGFRQMNPNRSPAERLRFGKEEQRHERALTFLPKAQKVGASDIKLAPTWWVVLTKKIPSNRGLSTAFFCFCIRLHLNLSAGSDLFAQPDISSFTYLLAKLYVFCIIIRESDCQSIRLRLHLIWMFEFRFACNKNINIGVIIIP